MGARLVAEPGPGFFDAVVEIEPEELEPCLREPRRLGRAATAGAAFHGPGRDPRQPERHRARRSGRAGTIGDGVDELAFGDNLPVREVKHLADGLRLLHRQKDGIDKIAHIDRVHGTRAAADITHLPLAERLHQLRQNRAIARTVDEPGAEHDCR